MLEPRRSRYLRALGIDVYVPRLILPGALPSVACEWEAAPEPVATTTGVCAVAVLIAEPAPVAPAPVAPQVDPAPARSPLSDIDLPSSGAPRKAERLAEPVAASAPARAAADAAPNIALSMALGSGVLLVDDAPNPAERGEYHRLLGNILFALRGDGAQLVHDIFLWPLSKQPQLDHSAGAARETLAAYVQSQIERNGVHTVLLLGDAAQQWLQIDAGALQCARSVSALGCLRQPADKRQLWHDIRHLAVVH